MPTQQRGDKVGGAKEVEGAGEREAGDAVQAGGVPSYLRTVDGEVRGDGPVAALGGEDGVRFVLGDRACGCGTGLGVGVGVRCCGDG